MALLTAFLAALAQATVSAPDVDYVILEGGGPDQGPGRDVERNFASLRGKLGPVDPAAPRQYGCGVQQLRILSRSAAVVAGDVGRALDAAEKTGVPVWLHVDPLYAWGADTETRPEDAPAVKFWEQPEMREWGEWPDAGGALPAHVPRLWFNWGVWCSPSPAVPALGAPKFVDLARKQLAAGVLDVLSPRLERWSREGKLHLFAGLNIGWETQIPPYPMNWSGIVADFPRHLRGLKPDPRVPGLQLGYASLHWRGWDEAKVVEAARKAGIPRDEQVRRLCHAAIRDYMEALARECLERGLPAERVYTHIVALATVRKPDTNHPPIWTAVNPCSRPGFTMDNKGAAKFDLPRLVREVADAPGSRRDGFGAVETYWTLGGRTYVTDADAYLKELEELFAAGARVKVVYAAFPLDAGRAPDAAFDALRKWLQAGRR